MKNSDDRRRGLLARIRGRYEAPRIVKLGASKGRGQVDYCLLGSGALQTCVGGNLAGASCGVGTAVVP